MRLSEFQQKVVKDILSGKVYDLISYAMAVPVKLWGGEYSKQRYEVFPDLVICPGDPVNKAIDENEAFVQLKEFVALWDYLERLGLIKGIQIRQGPARRLTIFGADDAPHYTILSLVYPYVNKQIAVLPGLSDFVERGFLTEAEFFHQKEIEDRKEALRLTRRVAYISLGISIAVAVFTTLFSFLAYRTDRFVTITNPKAFVDTTKVILVDPPPSFFRAAQTDSTGDSASSSNRTR